MILKITNNSSLLYQCFLIINTESKRTIYHLIFNINLIKEYIQSYGKLWRTFHISGCTQDKKIVRIVIANILTSAIYKTNQRVFKISLKLLMSCFSPNFLNVSLILIVRRTLPITSGVMSNAQIIIRFFK